MNIKNNMKVLLCFLLLSLAGCSGNNETSRFNQWKLNVPKSQLKENFSSEKRGIHGDGYDFFSYELTEDYYIYINKYLTEKEIIFTTLISFSDLPLEIKKELTLLENDKIIKYLGNLKRFKVAMIPEKNNSLIVFIDEYNEIISFLYFLK